LYGIIAQPYPTGHYGADIMMDRDCDRRRRECRRSGCAQGSAVGRPDQRASRLLGTRIGRNVVIQSAISEASGKQAEAGSMG